MRKYPFFQPLIALMAITLCFSCQKSSESQKVEDPDLKAIKTWFYDELATRYNSTEQQLLNAKEGSKKILWENAEFYTDGDNKVIQVPFLTKNAKAYRFHKDKNARIPLSLQDDRTFRYVVFVTHKDESRAMYLMTLVPEGNSLPNANSLLTGYFYGNLDKGYTGFVMYQNWSGLFLSSYQAENGKLVAKLSEPVPEEVKHVSLSNAREESYVYCTTTTITEFCEDCTNWTFSNGEYSYEFCSPTYVCGSETYQSCIVSDSPTSPGGGWTTEPSSSNWSMDRSRYLCERNLFTVKAVGLSWTGEAQDLVCNFRLLKSPWTTFTISYASICFSIPHQQGAVNMLKASEIFRLAWNDACRYTDLWLDAQEQIPNHPPITQVAISDHLWAKFLEFLDDDGGAASSASRGACQGGVPKTKANYGSDCDWPI